MLCIEGIQLMLNIFNGRKESPNYALAPGPGGKLQTMTVSPEVRTVLRWYRNDPEANLWPRR
jgi:phenylalanyl-tRNA synthetase beta chain